MPAIETEWMTVDTGKPGTLFTVVVENQEGYDCTVIPPRFEINGRDVEDFVFTGRIEKRELPRDGLEATLHYASQSDTGLTLAVIMRSYRPSSFLRFRYELRSAAPVMLTKTGGKDNLRYFALSTLELTENGHGMVSEIQLSHFDPVTHSYLPAIQEYEAEQIYDGQQFIGPIMKFGYLADDLYIAYEHGADAPNSFFEYAIYYDDNPSLELWATKGNYYDGQIVSDETPFTSVWFQLGRDGNIEPTGYRQFMLEEVCENLESRKPYLFYNTWNYQERLKYFEGKPYLHDMNFDRMSREIDVAHQLGIDVFVIDTGWYGKTGDWEVNLERFPTD